jgi:DivIVA domain-containing protein
MIDESFHLTPLDVRRTEFPNEFRGYDKTVVEQFRERVYEELERLTKVNQDLDTKAKNFHEQLRAFRERDKALNEALVAAQQLRAEIREQAEREAQLIVREAKAEAEQGLTQVREDVRRVQDEIQQLWRIRRGYLAQLRTVVERQLSELVAAESEPAPAGVATRDGRPEEPTTSREDGSARASTDASKEAQPILKELRDLPTRGTMPTPSWLDVVDD